MRMRNVFPLVLAGMMSLSAPAFVYASSTDEQIADVQAQKAAAEAELSQQQANMASLESKKQELESYLGELNQQYNELTNSVSELGIQAAQKEDELKTLKKELKKAKKQSKKQYEDMKKRIVYMYENGSASMLELLLSSEDLSQFLNRAENIAQISKYDRDMLEKYKDLQAKIKTQEEQAEEEAVSINSLLAEKSAKQQEVQAITASTSENIQSYIYEISASQDEIDALNTQISNADSSIYTLLQTAEAEKAAAAAQENAVADSYNDGTSGSDGGYDSSENFGYDGSGDVQGTYDESYDSTNGAQDSYDDSYDNSEDGGASYDVSSDSTDSADTTQSSSSGQGTYLGTFTLTAYCNCAQCCGTAGNLTASGTVPTAGRTVAMAGVPFGTQLLINGTVYTVEDLGTPYGHVDIYCNSHSEALAFGLQSAEVYRLN